MDAYNALLIVLLAGSLTCFWRAWRSGEFLDVAATLRRRAEQSALRLR